LGKIGIQPAILYKIATALTVLSNHPEVWVKEDKENFFMLLSCPALPQLPLSLILTAALVSRDSTFPNPPSLKRLIFMLLLKCTSA
jgi:hypothetical protein